MHCFFDVRVDIRNGNNRRIAYDEPVAHCRPGLQEGAADLIGVPDAGPRCGSGFQQKSQYAFSLICPPQRGHTAGPYEYPSSIPE